jgi:hypothetical protein
MAMPTLDEARAAKNKAASLLQHASDVVGIGIARQGGGYCVKVNLSHAPAAADSMPTSIDGVPVRVEVVGILRKRGPTGDAVSRPSKRSGRR